MKSVFISYSTKDREVAAKVKARLEAAGIAVTIDSESLRAGGNIRDFIDKSIRETQVTLSIVSKNSLESDWVALESVESFAAERYVEGKKFIACYIHADFLRDEYSLEATEKIDNEIKAIEKLIEKAAKSKSNATHLETKKARKYELKHNLSKILDRLLTDLTLDIRKPKFDDSLQHLIKTIKGLPDLASPHPSQTGSSNRLIHTADRERQLDYQYLDWLRAEWLLGDLKYTELSGSTNRKAVIRNLYQRKRGGKTGIADFYAQDDHKQAEPFDDAVTEILKLRRAVLLGDPGSGKTTTLSKMAERLGEDAVSDPKAPLPVLVRLGFWTSVEESLTDFIIQQSGPLPAPLDQLIRDKRVAILLDGINEIPTDQWNDKYDKIKDFIAKNEDLITVASCRELDYTVDLELHQIVIIPLDPLRIRKYVDDYLGPDRGEDLFWRLVGGDARKIHDKFIESAGAELDDPEQTFWLSRQLPKDIRFWQWGDWVELRDNPGSLLVLSRNPFMLNMICEIYEQKDSLPENKGKLFDRFVTVLIQREIDSKKALAEEMEPLLEALSQLAYEMQINPTRLLPSANSDEHPDDDEEEDEEDNEDDDELTIKESSKESGKARTSLKVDRVRELIGKRRLVLALSANLLAGHEEIRFAHQLLQEYFTAVYMKNEIRRGDLKATEIWPAESWWQRTNWEVATVLLAGLRTDDCTEVVDWVAAANPEVAAECIVLSGSALAIPTKKRLRREWRTRLLDPARDTDPRARAAVGRALGLTGWDNRDGIGTKKVEIEGQTIVLPDFDKAWVEIPAGEFTCGHKDESRNPPRRVMLPAFRISRYPVTFAQFQTFIDDPEGYRNQDRWFEGLAADEDDRRLEDQYFRIEGKAYSNDPRETVNWYQSVAFCRWLSWRLGGGYDLKKIDEWKVRLPTELEWERAARGLDGRIYPYGNEFDAARGNTYATGIGRTTTVGIFSEGSSPDGVLDMSGNVWQWCLNSYSTPQSDPARVDLTTSDRRPLRGGSWLYDLDCARAVYRLDFGPFIRGHGIGFRVVSVVRPPS